MSICQLEALKRAKERNTELKKIYAKYGIVAA